MKLDGLKTLYKDMKRNGILREQFQYRHNNVVFDIIFFIDSSPFELLFGAVGYPCSFFVKVKNGFEISPIITPSTAYKELCKALRLTYDPSNPFNPAKFFSDFALHIPSHVTAKNVPTLLVNTRPSIETEGEKIYFSHWKNNSDKSGHVTDENLKKTANAFGSEIKDFCKRKNISSCWSPKQKKSTK